MKSRVAKSYVEAIGPNQALTSVFGGIVGITALGDKAIEAFLVLVAPKFWVRWEEALKSSQMESACEITQCQTALLNAMGIFMLKQPQNISNSVYFSEQFSEKLTPFCTYDSSYQDCIL